MGRSRSRDRKEKKSSRRARSDDSTSSREREKRRRKAQQQFLMNGKRRNAESNMYWDGFQWIARNQDGLNNILHNATRRSRRLYIANIPMTAGINEEQLGQYIFAALRERGLVPLDAPSPVVHVWFAREKGGTYGFVEFQTTEDTDRALALDGMVLMGNALSIKRPSDYQAPILPGLLPGQLPALPAVTVPEVKATSRIVRMVRVLPIDDDVDEDDFLDVRDDMQDEGKKFGDLIRVLMARADVTDPASGDLILNAGDALMEFSDLESAERCFEELRGRKYENKVVTMVSVDEEQWQQTLLPILLEMNDDE
jgi:splicing factor U2AF subunit